MSRHAATLILVVLCTSQVTAALTPDQIAIIARAGDKDSEAVAKYYAKVRKVPRGQILAMPFPDGEELSRADWDTKYRPAIRKWLRDKKLGNKIKCFVTVWGVPLKIDKGQPDNEQKRYDVFLRGERRNRIKRINDVIARLHEIGLEEGVPAPPPLSESASATEIRDLFQKDSQIT